MRQIGPIGAPGRLTLRRAPPYFRREAEGARAGAIGTPQRAGSAGLMGGGKRAAYGELAEQLAALIAGEPDLVANAANIWRRSSITGCPS